MFERQLIKWNLIFLRENTERTRHPFQFRDLQYSIQLKSKIIIESKNKERRKNILFLLIFILCLFTIQRKFAIAMIWNINDVSRKNVNRRKTQNIFFS